MTLSPLMREAIRAAKAAGRDAARALVPITRPGTVASVAPTNTTAMVVVDGPEGDATTGPHGADVVAPIVLQPGDRVMLLFTPPHGCSVIGAWSGGCDYWHVVGDEGEPPFLNAWANVAGTTFPGQNGPAQIMFTRRGDTVELRGQCERSTGGASIFELPEPYWPDNDLLLPAQGALGAHISITIDMATGTLAVASGNVAVLDGVRYLARIQQPD